MVSVQSTELRSSFGDIAWYRKYAANTNLRTRSRNIDLGIQKEITFGSTEHPLVVSFKAEAYNLFNHFNPGNPATGLSINCNAVNGNCSGVTGLRDYTGHNIRHHHKRSGSGKAWGIDSSSPILSGRTARVGGDGIA